METTVDIPDDVVYTIVAELKTSIDGLNVRNFYPATIHRIPIYVQKGNESAYAPTFVSIGPYHRDLHEQITRGMKILYLKNFLRRTRKDMETYASLIKSLEEEARDCYHDRCNGLESKEFVQMMVLDGCFIIELLLEFKEGIRDWFLFKVHNTNDLMLMENQIPFFILKLILDNSGVVLPEVQGGVTVNRRPEILDLCLFFFNQGEITKGMLEPTHQEGDGENVYHLLHLSYLCHMVDQIIPEMESPPGTLQDHLIEKTKRVFYFIAHGFLFLIKFFLLFFLSPFIFLLIIMWHKRDMHIRQKVRAEEKTKRIPTATELNESGVTFVRKEDAKNSMDVSFEIKNGIMKIPVVHIDDSSSSKFRNYLALEQNCPEVGNVFTGYVLFMNYLIDTASDVALLKNRNIIVSMLGSDEEVAKLFNGLTDGLVFDYRNYYLSNNINLKNFFVHVDSYSTRNRIWWGVIINKLRRIINKLRRNIDTWMALLVIDYLSSPWKIISLLGAVTLLACSVTQVVYAIKRK